VTASRILLIPALPSEAAQIAVRSSNEPSSKSRWLDHRSAMDHNDQRPLAMIEGNNGTGSLRVELSLPDLHSFPGSLGIDVHRSARMTARICWTGSSTRRNPDDRYHKIDYGPGGRPTSSSIHSWRRAGAAQADGPGHGLPPEAGGRQSFLSISRGVAALSICPATARKLPVLLERPQAIGSASHGSSSRAKENMG
jgi:hypothetical protein